MAQTPQRGGVRDLNAERAAQQDQNQMVQAVDTFAPVQSTVFGQTQVQGSKLMNSLAKFGTEVGAIEFEKEQKAAFLKGQTMRASGEEMADSPPPPTRRGFKAMDAKIKTQEWYALQKQAIDNGENMDDPLNYGEAVSTRIKDMLTGDRELDSMITEAALPLVNDLGRYQAKANAKARTAAAIAQSTSDVTGSVRLLKEAQKSGDQKGEASARARLVGALKMPVLSDPVLRQQTYADVAALSLDMGDPTALNYVREQEIEFSPEQERQLLAAETRYTANKKGELDTQYQHALADLEADVSTAATLGEVRKTTSEFQDQWPSRKTNNFFASLESGFRRTQAKNMLNKSYVSDYLQGNISKQPGVSNKQLQETTRIAKAQIDANPELNTEEKEQQKQAVWSASNTIDDDKKRRWDAGMTNPFLASGEINPDFEDTYGEAVAHFRRNPDLMERHLSAENVAKFKMIHNLSEFGGLAVRDAAAVVRSNKENARELTSDEREEMRTLIDEEVDTVLGKGFSNVRYWTDAIGVTTPVRNEGMVRERITRLAETYMQTGYPDAEAATSAARKKIMETHEQVGDSVIYNGGKSLLERMNLPSNELEGAIEYQKNAIIAANPDFNADDLVLMGDPLSNGLLFANKNSNGVISDVVSVDLAAAGAAYDQEVLVPKREEQARSMDAAAQLQATKMKLHEEAIATGIYTPAQSEAALTNWLGSFVLKSRVDASIAEEQAPLREGMRQEVRSSGLQAQIDSGEITEEEADLLADTMVDTVLKMNRDSEHIARMAKREKAIKDNGLRSGEEYSAWDGVQKALQNQNTPEQVKMLEGGNLLEYEVSRESRTIQDAFADITRWEGTSPAEAIEGGGMTGGYGLTNLTEEEQTATEGMSDGRAALTVVKMRHTKLAQNAPGYVDAPEAVKRSALDTVYNSGSLFENQAEALKNGDYKTFAKELLDVVRAPDPVKGGKNIMHGLARRRAHHYNMIAAEQGFPEIAEVRVTNSGVVYIDRRGNTVLEEDGQLHSRAKEATFTF